MRSSSNNDDACCNGEGEETRRASDLQAPLLDNGWTAFVKEMRRAVRVDG